MFDLEFHKRIRNCLDDFEEISNFHKEAINKNETLKEFREKELYTHTIVSIYETLIDYDELYGYVFHYYKRYFNIKYRFDK